MEVVSGGDKTCLSPENSPGHRGERKRRRMKKWRRRTLVNWMDGGWAGMEGGSADLDPLT